MVAHNGRTIYIRKIYSTTNSIYSNHLFICNYYYICSPKYQLISPGIVEVVKFVDLLTFVRVWKSLKSALVSSLQRRDARDAIPHA